jgi:hypothetical protein
MADAAIVGLLALVAGLLFMCWIALRFIGAVVEALSSRIHSFLYQYERLNNFEERKRIGDEIAVDRDFAEWGARQKKGGK